MSDAKFYWYQDGLGKGPAETGCAWLRAVPSAG